MDSHHDDKSQHGKNEDHFLGGIVEAVSSKEKKSQIQEDLLAVEDLYLLIEKKGGFPLEI